MCRCDCDVHVYECIYSYIRIFKSGGHKRKSKWDVVTPETRAVHEAVGSFMASPSSSATLSRQQLTPAQEEQLREQIAVRDVMFVCTMPHYRKLNAVFPVLHQESCLQCA